MAKRSRRFHDFDEIYGSEATHWKDQRDKSVEERFQKPKQLKAKTPNQQIYMDAIESSVVTIADGPPGCGKTYIACGVAARMLREGLVDKIVVARPLVGCEEELGFLPGGMDEKVAPYLAAVFDAFGDFFDPKEMDELVRQGRLVVCPLAVMRGRSFRRTFLVLDEAANATKGQLRMLLTRFGEGSKVVVSGDIYQSDIAKGKRPPLCDVIDKLNGHKDIAIIRLTEEDIVRHPLIRWIDERLHGD